LRAKESREQKRNDDTVVRTILKLWAMACQQNGVHHYSSPASPWDVDL
jgi:hypothetical protein